MEIFRKLYEENRFKLYYMALNILCNETDAEDAVHTGFVKLAERFEEYREQSYENLTRLITTIVKNAALDIARDYSWRASFFEEPGFDEENISAEDGEVLDMLIRDMEEERLFRAILQLGDFEKQLLHMQYEMNMKPKQIGELMSMPSSIVRKRILRARQKLEKVLTDTENVSNK